MMTLSSLEPGTILGKRYELRRVLGSGGMAWSFKPMTATWTSQ